jgi:translation initiation factor IF-3
LHAREIGLDLVQVSKNDRGVPVCKFADAGKLKFEASKKKTHVKPTETKEMMFHLRTGSHDIQIKKNKIRNMLAKKCQVKFGIELKGRERSFINDAKQMLLNTVQDLSDVARWDNMQAYDDSVFFILYPNKSVSHEPQSNQANKV